MSLIFFLSDVHLGALDREREKEKENKLISFFDFVEKSGAQLIIVGDLFDFWFEYKHAIPKQHFRILGRLAHLSSKNQIHYIAGNHDFWLNSFIKNEIGLIIHPDFYVKNINNQKLFICHGDGLLKNDYGYRLLKRIFRKKMNIFLYRLIHPDIGIPFALYCSHLSRNSAECKKPYKDIDYRQFAYKKINEGYDVVVLGHTHWAALEKHNNGYYLNPGFWGMDFTFAVVDHGNPAILQWDGNSAKEFHTSIPAGNNN